LKNSCKKRDKANKVESRQRAHASESEKVKEGAKHRKKTSEELLFPTIEEINESFIWNQDYMFNVPITYVHLAKDFETNHRILKGAKETYN
jgi:hypothetical protein